MSKSVLYTFCSVKKCLRHSTSCPKVYLTLSIASKSVFLTRSPCFSRSAPGGGGRGSRGRAVARGDPPARDGGRAGRPAPWPPEPRRARAQLAAGDPARRRRADGGRHRGASRPRALKQGPGSAGRERSAGPMVPAGSRTRERRTMPRNPRRMDRTKGGEKHGIKGNSQCSDTFRLPSSARVIFFLPPSTDTLVMGLGLRTRTGQRLGIRTRPGTPLVTVSARAYSSY